MLNLYKKKKFVKFSIPIGILGMLYLFFFLSQNLDTNNYKKPINKEFFSSLNKDFDNFFEIKKVNLLGRSKTDINLIKNIVSSSLKNENNIIRNDFKKIKIGRAQKLPLRASLDMGREGKEGRGIGKWKEGERIMLKIQEKRKKEEESLNF